MLHVLFLSRTLLYFPYLDSTLMTLATYRLSISVVSSILTHNFFILNAKSFRINCIFVTIAYN